MQTNKKPINESSDPRLGRIDPKNSLFRDAVDKINRRQSLAPQQTTKHSAANKPHKKIS